MRVLMVNRRDAESVPGGDSVQMRETAAGLEVLGVEVVTAAVGELPSLHGFDILHVFNWDQLEPVLSSLNGCAADRPPVVLSPIFWHHSGHWFCAAVSARTTWKVIRTSLGSSRSFRLYENWQQAKFRWQAHGRRLRRRLFSAAQVLPNSRLEIEHLQSVLRMKRIPPSRITVVPNGVRRELFQPRPAPDPSFLEEYGMRGFVLQVARIQAAKNQLGLITALFDLPIPIVFVGQPSPYEPEYVRRCRELAGERGNVYFVAPRPPEELAGIYAAAGVHVLPSWRETPGLASLEAAAAGCRVVSTDVGSAREYFGDLAWYCDPRDPASIRRAVTQALAAAPSEELRRRVLDLFTWDRAARITLEAYHRALEEARSDRGQTPPALQPAG